MTMAPALFCGSRLRGGFGDLTVTVSSTGASTSCTSRTAVCPAATGTSLAYGVNFSRVTSTVYVPGRRPETTYSPAGPVTTDFFPEGPLISTFAPATAPPSGSVTRPRSVAPGSSAGNSEADSSTASSQLMES